MRLRELIYLGIFLLFPTIHSFDILEWFGFTRPTISESKAQEPKLQIDPNYENRPLKNFNSTQTKRKTADPWGDPVPSSEEDSYWCYICIDQNGHSSSPALLAHLLQKQMRVPLAPSCSLDRYAYQIMCKGPCVVAMYTRGREFLGYLRDCASAAAFKAFSEQQLSQFPQPAPQVIGLGQDIYVELSICRGDYCNTDVRQTTRRARIPKNRLDAQNDHEYRTTTPLYPPYEPPNSVTRSLVRSSTSISSFSIIFFLSFYHLLAIGQLNY